MAHSLERRWARLVRSYARLNELYGRSKQREALLASQLSESRARVRELESESRAYKKASKNTMERLFATTRYAIAHLNAAQDLVAAEKLEEWLEVMEDTMQPVANLDHLIALLEEWTRAMPIAENPQAASVAWVKTRVALNALTGRENDAEPQ